jgi:hypothetical protein
MVYTVVLEATAERIESSSLSLRTSSYSSVHKCLGQADVADYSLWFQRWAGSTPVSVQNYKNLLNIVEHLSCLSGSQ